MFPCVSSFTTSQKNLSDDKSESMPSRENAKNAKKEKVENIIILNLSTHLITMMG